jgi:hypothetical protein
LDKHVAVAPGKLSAILEQGLSGHHLLFDPGTIRAAFAVDDAPISSGDADEVGRALLAIARGPIGGARAVVEGLPPAARIAFIRLYFRMLDRAEGKKGIH